MPSSDPPPHAAREILEICHDIEVASGRLYAAFADGHRSDPKISELWRKTAKEEEEHAEQIRLALKLEGVVHGASVTLDEARAVLEELRERVAAARKKAPPIAEALAFAIDLEKRLAAFHVAQAALFATSGQKTLFEAMMRADDGHVVKLEAALRAHAGSAQQPGHATPRT